MRRVKTVLLLASLAFPAPVFAADAAQTPPSEPVAAPPAPVSANAKLDATMAYKAQFGRAEDVAILLSQGASPNGVDERGQPALSVAAMRKDDEGIEIMKTLAKAGAQIDVRDAKGQTPLFYAAKSGSLQAVKWLLANRAQYYITDNEGNIARNIAYAKENKEVFEYMDKFVEGQRQAVLKQYADVNRNIEEKYRQERERLKAQQQAITEEKRKLEEEKRKFAEEQKPQPPTYEKEHQEVDELRDAYASGAFEAAVHKLSLEACLYQYWFHVRRVGVSSELKDDALDAEVEAHEQAIQATQNVMMENYKLRPRYFKNIIEPSQKKIMKVMRQYGSNATLSSNGIGKITDAQKRCKIIARDWKIEPRAETAK